MSNTEIIPAPKLGLMAKFADDRGLSVKDMYETLAKTIFPNERSATREQLHAFLLVAEAHGLNPFTREIWAFPGKGGGVVPIVSVDGWYKLTNGHPDCDGIEVDVAFDNGEPVSATCRIYRKSWSRPTEITEYLSEVKRGTVPWKTQPVRMLRHRAITQCARIAFGFAGIYEPDEAARFAEDVPAELREAESETLIKMREKIAQSEEPANRDWTYKEDGVEPEDAEVHEPSPVELFADAQDDKGHPGDEDA